MFSYKLRVFKNKGAVLAMIWGFFSLLVLVKATYTPSDTGNYYYSMLIMGGSSVLYPFMGWLADVHFGRYNVVKSGMWIMWIASLMYAASMVIADVLSLDSTSNYVILPIVAIGAVGLSGFQANIVQFGLDQLIDASSREISSYISWYVWCIFASEVLIDLSYNYTNSKFISVSSLLFPICFTVALCSDFFCKKWLIREPPTFNPIKLILKVFQYAIKNKYPRLNSDFWDSKHFFSRIDLGKSKYGGPFTTEQVEDVKTFVRITVTIVIAMFFSGIIFNLTDSAAIYHYKSEKCTTYFNCLKRQFIVDFGSFSMFLLIPLLELVVYPVFWRYNISIMKKFLMGMCLLLLHVICLLSLEIAGHMTTPADHNVTCLQEPNSQSALSGTLDLSMYWLLIPNFLYGPAFLLVASSALEFVCAQSPYSMKGLLVGLMYISLGSSAFCSYLIKKLFQYLSSALCRVWFFIFAALLTCLFILVSCYTSKAYVKRKRGDILLNEEEKLLDHSTFPVIINSYK